MKYLLSIVLLALIGVTTPKKTTPAYDWGSVSAKPDLSWADQVGAQRTPKNTEWDAGKFGLRNDTSVFSTPAIQALSLIHISFGCLSVDDRQCSQQKYEKK